MDKEFFIKWFEGFSNGLEEMDPIGRSILLKPCAKQCADTGVLKSYLEHYCAVGGERDEFYRRLSEMGDVRGEVLISGREYRICFPHCACDLHTACGVKSPHLCECSRQSILYVAETVWKGCGIRVETESTILSGATECRFRIIFQ